MPNIHIAILFTNNFTLNKLGHCLMSLQYYTFKIKLKETIYMYVMLISDCINNCLQASTLLFEAGSLSYDIKSLDKDEDKHKRNHVKQVFFYQEQCLGGKNT